MTPRRPAADRVYGGLGKIGLLVPTSNTTMESEISLCLPKDIAVHTARIPLADITNQGLEHMCDSIPEGILRLTPAHVDVIAYGCTTGSFIRGPEHPDLIHRESARLTEVPIVTTAEAVISVMRRAQGSKILIVTPYVEELNVKLEKFVNAQDFEVLGISALGLTDNHSIGNQPPSKTYELAADLIEAHPTADLLLISCTNLPTYGIIHRLMTDFDIKVVGSVLATLIESLRQLGIADDTISELTKDF